MISDKETNMARKKALIPTHEVAFLFPEMDEAEYWDLRDNIGFNGLREPIWLYQGKIIDGKHRYKACLETGTEPYFRDWDGKGSLVEFVVSLNLYRRHLQVVKGRYSSRYYCARRKLTTAGHEQTYGHLEKFPKVPSGGNR
jgi:hypothetical protein